VLLPFDFVSTFARGAAAGCDLRRLEATVAQFATEHPYLLFNREALGDMRRIAGADPRLEARFALSLATTEAQSGPTDIRTAVKKRARRLIAMAFVAVVGDDRHREEALAHSRRLLLESSTAESWRERQVIKSFLDCGETAVAVALAYDWLYDRLPGDERLGIERALVRQILEPALSAYEDEAARWPRRRDNCCLVSNCAITIAALAVLRRRPSLVAGVLRHSLASAWNAFAGFAPDGAWPEGLSYWALAARYAGLMVAALESALGDSFGLADRPGFAATGDFALHAAGPFGAAFDFGDSVRQFDAAALAWLAHRFRRPVDGWLLGDYEGWHLPLTMIWPVVASRGPAELGLTTGKVFRGADLACFRNTWEKGAAAGPVYLAIKGGNSRGTPASAPARPDDTVLHAQADAGSFILDGARHRWAIDLGGDDYDLPGYFEHGADGRSGRRWRYYRVGTAGHNTLTIDGLNQDPRTRATILGSCVEGGCKWVVYDLSAVYGKAAGSIRRGAALIGREVVIADEIAPHISSTIVWTMHTSAEPVSVAADRACFRHGEDRLVARILEPAAARFELTLPPAPGRFAVGDVTRLHGRPRTLRRGARIRELPRRDDDGERRGAGAPIRRLQIVLPAGARRLAVLLLPDCDAAAAAEESILPIAPLDSWLARHPVRLASCPPPPVAKKRRRNPARGSAVTLATAINQPFARRLRTATDRA
jgi:Heparinase II/III-like protein